LGADGAVIASLGIAGSALNWQPDPACVFNETNDATSGLIRNIFVGTPISSS
jgi:hypothetical protein